MTNIFFKPEGKVICLNLFLIILKFLMIVTLYKILSTVINQDAKRIDIKLR